jgi:hypothetical protein
MPSGPIGERNSPASRSRPRPSGAGASNLDVWKFIQQAVVAWHAPLGRGLLLEAGLFLSPIGPEGMAVKDQWNWSRSNLFFGLPFYHTGMRASYGLSDTLTLSVAAYNGWNSVVDNNDEKSVSAALDAPERQGSTGGPSPRSTSAASSARPTRRSGRDRPPGATSSTATSRSIRARGCR